MAGRLLRRPRRAAGGQPCRRPETGDDPAQGARRRRLDPGHRPADHPGRAIRTAPPAPSRRPSRPPGFTGEVAADLPASRRSWSSAKPSRLVCRDDGCSRHPRSTLLSRRSRQETLDELAEPRPQLDPVPAQARDAGESLAQMPAVRRDDLHQGMGGESSSSARAATITAGSARERGSSSLFDPGYSMLPPPQVREDPLKFRDSKRYTDRLKAARDGDRRERRLDQRPRHDRGRSAPWSASRISPSWADRWAWRSAPPSSPAPGPRSPTAAPTSSSPRPAARGCRKAYCR